MNNRIHVKDYEEGYRIIAEKLDLPAEDPVIRLEMAKSIIKSFVEL